MNKPIIYRQLKDKVFANSSRPKAGLNLTLLLLTVLIPCLLEAVEPVQKHRVLGGGSYAGECWEGATQTLDVDGAVTIEAGAEVAFRAPEVILRPGFQALGNSRFIAGIPSFKVHFVNLVDPARTDPGNVFYGSGGNGPSDVELRDFCENEITVMNDHFKTQQGDQLIRFIFGEAVNWDPLFLLEPFYDCIAVIGMENCGSKMTEFNSLPADHPIRDEHSLNFIIFDNPISNNSYGNGNPGNPPVVMIDYNRIDDNEPGILDGGRSGVEEHEMGHVFALGHVRDNQVITTTTPSNIMSSTGNGVDNSAGSTSLQNGDPCDGYMGLRNTGFFFEPFDNRPNEVCQFYYDLNYIPPLTDRDYGQAEIILSYSRDIEIALGMSPWP